MVHNVSAVHLTSTGYECNIKYVVTCVYYGYVTRTSSCCGLGSLQDTLANDQGLVYNTNPDNGVVSHCHTTHSTYHNANQYVRVLVPLQREVAFQEQCL